MYKIEKKFGKCDKGLTIEQFIKVMLQHLDYVKEDNDKRM